MVSELFDPFVRDSEVDARLLKVLGLPPGGEYRATFDHVLDAQENTRFDLYMQSRAGQKIFVDVKRSGEVFAACEAHEQLAQKIDSEYRPLLHEHVDAKWLEPATFCANREVLRMLSYLGRYSDSGALFIFPKANEKLMEAGATIKQIVSKSLAPRTAILYLEYLVERILEAVAGDAALTQHYLAFRERYVFSDVIGVSGS